MVISYLVGALEQRRRQAERREQETRRLYELSSSLVAHGSLEDTLASVVRTVRSLFDLAGCAIVLPEGDDGKVRVAASDGQVPQALAANLTVQVHGAGTGELQPGQALTVPLRAGAEPVGALVVIAGGPGSQVFGEAERRLPATFANQAALAVDQGRQDEQRARTRALEEIDRLRTALLNSVSHDLRTPLASIKASASSLLDPEVRWSEEQRREFLTTIDQEADRLTRLVHNLLDMSRIEAGALDLRLQETSLAEVAGPVVRGAWAWPSAAASSPPSRAACGSRPPQAAARPSSCPCRRRAGPWRRGPGREQGPGGGRRATHRPHRRRQPARPRPRGDHGRLGRGRADRGGDAGSRLCGARPGPARGWRCCGGCGPGPPCRWWSSPPWTPSGTSWPPSSSVRTTTSPSRSAWPNCWPASGSRCATASRPRAASRGRP